MPQVTESAAQQDIAFMQMALEQARLAAAAGEVPVGAVVVRDGKVLGLGRNGPIHASDPTAHAEVMALRAAALNLGNYRLEDCSMYVTLEPCAMCSGGILHARLKRLIFGAADPKTGCAGSVLNLFSNQTLNHQTQVDGGLLAQPSSELLADFFRRKRAQQRVAAEPLREDALRTPERFFAQLSHYPWPSHYVSDLPSLAGLRLHFLDDGPVDAESTLLCLHPVPGWSYSYRKLMANWLHAGHRVVLPDLIGFGKSDKPKHENFHSPRWHATYMRELLEHLDLKRVSLLVGEGAELVAQLLANDPSAHIQGVQVTARPLCDTADERMAERDTPFPDTGHRAAERAFAKLAWRSVKMRE